MRIQAGMVIVAAVSLGCPGKNENSSNWKPVGANTASEASGGVPSTPAPPSPAAPAPAMPQIPLPPPGGQAAAGVHFTAPSTWTVDAPRAMRLATYKIPAAKGDNEEGECGVFFFGPQQGGGVDANLTRWLGQFTLANGQPIAAFDKRNKMEVAGMPITEVDVAGTFLFSATPMSPDRTPKPGYRMLGAIVEGPQGSVFFKFTGPAATVAANAGAFDGMLKSITRS